MRQETFTVIQNHPIAKNTYRMILKGNTSGICGSGQFVNLKIEGFFLRRPISVSDYEENHLTLIYKIVGKGTKKMAAALPGTEFDILTGLGNGYNLEKSLMGISGIETAFPLMFTAFVKEKFTTLDNLVRLMSDNPKKRFGIQTEGDFTVFDPECEYTVDPDTFLSKGKATPFAGKTVSGRFLLTVCRGKTVYSEK